MANGANRIFNVMSKTGTDTISELLSLTVKSTNPLVLTDGDKLFLTKEFIYFDTYIDTSNIRVGDKFTATTYNAGQTYYIYDVLNSSQNIDKYMQEINSLKERVTILEGEVVSLKNRVTALENQ